MRWKEGGFDVVEVANMGVEAKLVALEVGAGNRFLNVAAR